MNRETKILEIESELSNIRNSIFKMMLSMNMI